MLVCFVAFQRSDLESFLGVPTDIHAEFQAKAKPGTTLLFFVENFEGCFETHNVSALE